MEINQKTGKLLVLFLLMHLVAGALGLITGVFFGAFAGIATFTAAIIVLPLLLQYLYLSKKS